MKRYVGIDPSSKTGFVALNGAGEVLKAKELTGIGSVDPKRIVSLVDEVIEHLQPGDIIGIEGYAYGAVGKGVSFQFELGGMLREWLYRKKADYTIITPTQLKKFSTGKGNTPKDAMSVPIYKRWGFESKSNNITDAFILAEIVRCLHTDKLERELLLTDYQIKVLEAIEGKA